MDTLNNYYPLYPQKPESTTDESEKDENNDYIEKLNKINQIKKRKKVFTIDDFCLKYSDDMWYIWCIIKDYSEQSNLLDKLSYGEFCEICYENSTKY
jgi:hypothetical protein